MNALSGKMLRLWVPVILGACLGAGCATVRWESPQRAGSAPEPAAALQAMSRGAPVRLQVVNSVLFEYRGRKMSGLGFLDVDVATRSFGLACMAQSGVTLFEVTGTNGAVRCHFAMPALAGRGEAFAKVLGRDVERMFFDVQPPAGAAVGFEPGAAVFSDVRGSGRVEWIAGCDGGLLEKRYYEGRRLVCRVGYYATVGHSGRRIPGRVCLQNLKDGYGLTITMREIRRCD
jgi:hypothetical protein